MLVLISFHRHQKFVQPQKPEQDFLHQQAIEVMLAVIVVGTHNFTRSYLIQIATQWKKLG